jgi:hypothetical protein
VTPVDDAERQQAVAWARSTIERAVQLFIDQGVLESTLLEAKPAWGIPRSVLIAMLREKGAGQHSFWLICGHDVPFDYVTSSAAASAREAARHFALKWQLEAARMRESSAAQAFPDGDAGSDPAGESTRLETRAEWLYRLVDDEGLWQQGWSSQ